MNLIVPLLVIGVVGIVAGPLLYSARPHGVDTALIRPWCRRRRRCSKQMALPVGHLDPVASKLPALPPARRAQRP